MENCRGKASFKPGTQSFHHFTNNQSSSVSSNWKTVILGGIKMKRIHEMNKGYLDPKIQTEIINGLKKDPKALIVLKAAGDSAEEILASWIYEKCLEPLGW